MLGHYHSLAPFLELFRTGLPILTYHKLGPRPRGVRLKGLYVSEKLFASQMTELGEAGFGTVPPGAASLDHTPTEAPTGCYGRSFARITITFDDGFCNVLRFGLKPLARHRFCAIQFLVADLIGKTNEWEQREGEAREPLMDATLIRDWLAAGHDIGSHSCTHPWLTRLPRDQAREEISASKKKLEDRFGRKVVHFCYPYGDWNETVRDLVQEAGYKTACTTDPGINMQSQSPFELKRFTVRYPSRKLKAILGRFRASRRANV